MSAGRGTTALYLGVIGGLILIGVVLFAPWPLWISVVAATALGATVLVVAGASERRPAVSSGAEPWFGNEPEPTLNRRTRVSEVPLPTNLEDYFFLFSATVIWSPKASGRDNSTLNSAALAVDAVLRRAGEITELRDPSQASLIQYELAGLLGEMKTDGTGRLRAMAESVQLVLPDLDRERLDKLASIRKEEAIWEHARKHEQSKRAYLGGDVLKDPGSAVVWWLARNDDHVEKTVQDIGLLAQLCSAANNMDVPAMFRPFIPAFAIPNTTAGEATNSNGSGPESPPQHERPAADPFDSFLYAMGFDEHDPKRRLLARQMADWAAAHGRQDIADELIRRYDAPADGAPEGEGDGS